MKKFALAMLLVAPTLLPLHEVKARIGMAPCYTIKATVFSAKYNDYSGGVELEGFSEYSYSVKVKVISVEPYHLENPEFDARNQRDCEQYSNTYQPGTIKTLTIETWESGKRLSLLPGKIITVNVDGTNYAGLVKITNGPMFWLGLILILSLLIALTVFLFVRHTNNLIKKTKQPLSKNT